MKIIAMVPIITHLLVVLFFADVVRRQHTTTLAICLFAVSLLFTTGNNAIAIMGTSPVSG